MKRGCREPAEPAGNPLPRRLQITAGKAVTVLDAPLGFLKELEALPEDVRRSTTMRGKADVLLIFIRTRRQALAGAKAWKRSLAAGGMLWVCYPKLTSASAGELSRETLWRDLEPLGLRPAAMVAIDATWPAMRFKVLA